MSIQEWGPITWYLFHTLAEKIKDEYFEIELPNILNNIRIICNILPCPECKEHALYYLKTANVNKIKTKDQLKLFLLYFHNEVNARNNKKLFTFEELNKKYSTARLKVIIGLFFQIYNKKSGNMRLQLSTGMEKNIVLNNFTHYIKKNIYKYNY